MAPGKEDDKHEKIIRGLLKLPGNRRCINCGSLGPQYVCTSFSTFICTLCSGIHREFLHRIKSVSMAKFTAGEISELQSGGNDQARQIFLKAWNSDRNVFPDSSNPDKIREFIKIVYVQRRFTGEKTSQESRSPMHETMDDRDTRPSPRPSYGGLAYSTRSSVRTVPERRENGGLDRTTVEDNAEDDVRYSPQSPSNQKTASGSKRETVIRQLLQPPVEKRKNQQLQRNNSSGSITPDQIRPPHVQRSNSLSLKDLMTVEKSSHQAENPKPPAQSVTESKSLIDLTEKQQQQQKPPNSTNLPVAAKSSSTPCLIDLISGDATGESTSAKIKHGTHRSSNDLIDLISSPPEEKSTPPTQVDPFVTTSFAALDLAAAADPFAANTSSDQVPGPVQAQPSTTFTSFSAGPADLPQSCTPWARGEVSPHVLPPAFPRGAGPSPGYLPYYYPGFPGISPAFTVQTSAGFLPSNSSSMAVMPKGPVHHMGGFGPPSLNPMNPNLGHFGASTSVNPFDPIPLAQNLRAPPSITQAPPDYYHPNFLNYHQATPVITAKQIHPPVFQQQQHPATTSSGNPFA